MNQEKWKSALTKIGQGVIKVRGYDIAEMMEKLTFAESIFLLLKGGLPNKAEAKMMEGILVSSIDHGVSPPSVQAARTVFSGGNPLNAAVAGGILAIGDAHGGAIEECAKILQEWGKKRNDLSAVASELVKKFSEEKKRIPGFGHRLHEVDPRSVKLFQLAKKLNFGGKHLDLTLEIEKELEKSSGKKLPINVDGAIAAVISDMGFDWRLGKGFFIISRTAGLVAHTYEEWIREKRMRKIGEIACDYDGPPDRSIG
jgi:citryl-CoA lyase